MAACPESCNTKSKVLCGLCVPFVITGVICLIVAALGDAALGKWKPDLVASNSFSFNLTVQQGSVNTQFALLIKQSEANCTAVSQGIFVQGPGLHTTATDILWKNSCTDPLLLPPWMNEHKPPLRVMGLLSIPFDNGQVVVGDYQVTSPVATWAVDTIKESWKWWMLILKILGQYIAGIILIVAGLILSCVGCCCLGKPHQWRDSVPPLGHEAPLLEPPAAHEGELQLVVIRPTDPRSIAIAN